jgi:hypothetical protein
MKFLNDNSSILQVLTSNQIFSFCWDCFDEQKLLFCPDNEQYCSQCSGKIERPGEYWTVDLTKEVIERGAVRPEWSQGIFTYHEDCIQDVDLFAEAYEGISPFVRHDFEPREDTYILGTDRIHGCGHKGR